MRSSFKLATAVATAAIAVSALAMPASAECKRFGFLVNDYGKDGPTKDAKELLGKTIASKMAERGIKDYKTGTKTVTCELFLNFIVFDEHTCTAEATVCWGGSELPKGQQSAANSDDSDKTEPAAEPAKKVSHEKHKSSKSQEAKADGDGAAASSDAKPAKTAKADENSKSEEPAPAKKSVAAKSSGNGVADPVKPRIASAATPATSSVVTGSVDTPKKKEAPKSETKRKASTEDSAGYPQPLAPSEGQ